MTDETSKTVLRRGLLRARSRLTAGEREAAARAVLATALETRELIEALRLRGVRVLLPVLLPDNDLDWAVHEGPHALASAGRGLLEPTGPRLGPDAVTEAGTVLLPGLAVDARGLRLGRGGGSYDRVLERLAEAGSPAAPPNPTTVR